MSPNVSRSRRRHRAAGERHGAKTHVGTAAASFMTPELVIVGQFGPPLPLADQWPKIEFACDATSVPAGPIVMPALRPR